MAKSYLGVDLGATSIKIVELKEEAGRPRLVTYGYTEQTTSIPQVEFTETPDRAADYIKQVCAKAKTITRQGIAALPVASVFSSIINISASLKKDMASAVQWEAKKVIPLPLEEMILDWKVLTPEAGRVAKKKEEAKEGKPTPVLLTAAPRNLVKKYIDIFKLVGLNLVSLETEAFALIRSLIGADKSVIMIVDMGAASTNISIIDAGIPVLNRSLNLGGIALTRAISAGLGIDFDRAEQLKRDVGIVPTGQDGIPKIIETTLSPLVNEIKYCMNLYQSQEEMGEKRIEKIILTGGGATLPNLVEYLSKTLNLKIYIGDPWARVIYPEELKPVLDEIGPKFSVSIGLAMREIE